MRYCAENSRYLLWSRGENIFNGFKDVESAVRLSRCRITIAVAGSHGSHVLETVTKVCERGLSKAVLIRHQAETERLLRDMGYTGQNMDFAFADMDGDEAIVAYACDMVVQKKTDIPMKGIISTASFMRAILNRERGFVPASALISQSTLFEWQGRFIILTDCAINIAPDYDDKIKIAKNAATLAKKAGIGCPEVAVLAPMEVVNPRIESSVHVAMLTMTNKRDQIKECIIDGPLTLGNAISEGVARRKGIDSEAAGHADILIVPDLGAGNMFIKLLTFFAGLKIARTVNGTKTPVIMCPGADSMDDKYRTVFAALMQSICD